VKSRAVSDVVDDLETEYDQLQALLAALAPS
jgi:hypothetical protein